MIINYNQVSKAMQLIISAQPTLWGGRYVVSLTPEEEVKIEPYDDVSHFYETLHPDYIYLYTFHAVPREAWVLPNLRKVIEYNATYGFPTVGNENYHVELRDFERRKPGILREKRKEAYIRGIIKMIYGDNIDFFAVGSDIDYRGVDAMYRQKYKIDIKAHIDIAQSICTTTGINCDYGVRWHGTYSNGYDYLSDFELGDKDPNSFVVFDITADYMVLVARTKLEQLYRHWAQVGLPEDITMHHNGRGQDFIVADLSTWAKYIAPAFIG